MYLTKTPWWLRALYPGLVWRMGDAGKTIYLTFDDGPHQTATPFVLEQLQRYKARATFFCIGKNVTDHPQLYQQIIADGHSVGNHTQNHLNGWKTPTNTYIDNVNEAAAVIASNLFRPPYGRISRAQRKQLASDYKIIMWDVLSGDFDTNLTPEGCLGYVLYHTRPGSIIVFHDSAKALPRLQHTLPKVLEHFSKAGYRFSGIQ